MPQLLLELFSEEIPARMQAGAARDLERLVVSALSDRGYTNEGARAFATPRRLALVVEGLPAAQADLREERKGPRVDAPAQAIDGFLRSTGLMREQLKVQNDAKGDFYLAVIERKGRPTPDVVAEIVPEIVRAFPWPKSQRWGDGDLTWVRPLHSILCTFDGEVVKFEVGGIRSGTTTRGHRFMANAPIDVRRFDDYVDKLKQAYVVLDAAERKATILHDATQLAHAQNLELIADDGLADEVAGLVEWPGALIGTFDKAYLGVPQEILISTMRANQKYFALRDPKTGKLANKFIVVANTVTKDGGKAVVAGNERVLRARLSDAKFFWDQDLKHTLESRVIHLDSILYHANIGNVLVKAKNVERLAIWIASLLGADTDEVELAARLAKGDLLSGTVGEFPEVQGIIGRYLALHEKKSEAVADAIRDQYSPKGPNDTCPTGPVSVCLALADKIDTLSIFWANQEKPTGSKDPFGLRRAALGTIRVLLENRLRLPLSEAIDQSLTFWGYYGSGSLHPKTTAELLSFFAERLKVALRDRGVRHDLIDAVFALPGQDDLVLIVRRVEALQSFLKTDDGANLLTGYRRAANILRIEEKKEGRSFEGGANSLLLVQDEEVQLGGALLSWSHYGILALSQEDFVGAMKFLAGIRRTLDPFFDKVTVNADDPALRENRLKLLHEIRSAMHTVADFSKIEG